jgi:phage shock protein PspC (stress-responsive transcriptional regulator)
MQVNDRLYRSRNERVFAGVAGGVAERFDIDPSLVRVAWVILMLLTGGVFFLLYIVMAIVVPEAPARTDRWAAWQSGPEPGAVPGWGAAGAGEGSGPSAAAVAQADEPASAPTEGLSEATAGTSGFAGSDADTGGTFPAGNAGAAGWPSHPPDEPAPWAIPPRRRHRRERNGAGTVIFGLILVLVGAYFLVRTFFPDLDLSPFWPVVLIVIGGGLLVGAIRPGSGNDSSG